jgi:hypothetical protein
MMNNLSPVKYRTIQAMSILAALVFAAPALAEGCTVSGLEPDQLVDVGEFDGNMACSDWPSMASSNCLLDPDEDGPAVTCTITTTKGDITVSATKNNGAINWSAVSTVAGLGIDKVILDNANKANGCLQNNKFDTTEGSIVFIKSNGDPQPSQGAEFCADNIISAAPAAPQEAFPLPSCSATGYKLDSTGIICPTYTAEEAQEAIDAGCTDDCPVEGTEKPVVVCNLEKDKEDWGTTDGSDVCCQCGIPAEKQTACVVTEDRNECTQSMTVNPTQSVELFFFKDDEDPCTWVRTSQGWKQWCY